MDGGSVYLYETLTDLHGLFELLDVVEEEWRKVKVGGSVE